MRGSELSAAAYSIKRAKGRGGRPITVPGHRTHRGGGLTTDGRNFGFKKNESSRDFRNKE